VTARPFEKYTVVESRILPAETFTKEELEAARRPDHRGFGECGHGEERAFGECGYVQQVLDLSGLIAGVRLGYEEEGMLSDELIEKARKEAAALRSFDRVHAADLMGELASRLGRVDVELAKERAWIAAHECDHVRHVVDLSGPSKQTPDR